MELNFESILNEPSYNYPFTFYKLYINNIYVGNYYPFMKPNPEFELWQNEVWGKMSKEQRNEYPHNTHPSREIISHYRILSENGRMTIETCSTIEDVQNYFIKKCVK